MTDILKAIEEHGLSLRKIPEVTTHLYTKSSLERSNLLLDDDVVFEGPNGREVVKRFKVPEHAGWWMCQQVLDTDSSVVWSKKRHHLKPTLEESVLDFLNSVEV
mgnify:CR=1 FL=1